MGEGPICGVEREGSRVRVWGRMAPAPHVTRRWRSSGTPAYGGTISMMMIAYMASPSFLRSEGQPVGRRLPGRRPTVMLAHFGDRLEQFP